MNNLIFNQVYNKPRKSVYDHHREHSDELYTQFLDRGWNRIYDQLINQLLNQLYNEMNDQYE